MHQRQERILVCINYGNNGEKLINRAGSIAQQIRCPLFILVFDALSEDKYKYDKEVDMSYFQEFAHRYHARLIVEKGYPVDITNAIIKVASETEATQIMIGQQVESIWTKLIGGSVINRLLHKVPEADVHVIPKSRADESEEWEFDHGVKGYLLKQSNGSYQLTFEHRKNIEYEGIFFKQLDTDFDTGIFTFYHNKRVLDVPVIDGVVPSIDNLDKYSE